MIVQQCIKGLGILSEDQARSILTTGIKSRWWLAVNPLPAEQIPDKLTPGNLDRHINHFEAIDPATGQPFCELTPFISLTAGTVERRAAEATNVLRGARRVALEFATEGGRLHTADLFYCWILVAPREAVEVRSVAEEVRHLNVYRSFSWFQPEGEITAKIQVPTEQIECWERWALAAGSHGDYWHRQSIERNPLFQSPYLLSNVREML